MKKDQEITSKYWVCHNSLEEGVYISTASKSYSYAENKAIELLGQDYWVNEHFKIILIEIKAVDI